MNDIATNIMNLVMPTAAPSGGAERLGGGRRIVGPETAAVPDQDSDANSAPSRQGDSAGRDEQPPDGRSAGRRGTATQAGARRVAGKKAEGRAAPQQRGRVTPSAEAQAQGPTGRLNGKGAVAVALPGLAAKLPFAALLQMVVGGSAAVVQMKQPAQAQPGLAKGQPQAPVAAEPGAAEPGAAGPDVPKALGPAGARAVVQVAAPVAAKAKAVAQAPPAGDEPKPVAQAAPAVGKGRTDAQPMVQATATVKGETPAGETQPRPAGQVVEGDKAGQATAKAVSAERPQASGEQVLPARGAVAKQQTSQPQTSQPQTATAGEPAIAAAMRGAGKQMRAAPVAAAEDVRLVRPLKAGSARRGAAPGKGSQLGSRVGAVRPPQAAGESSAKVADAPSVASGRSVTVEFSPGQGEVGEAVGRPGLSDGISAPTRQAAPELPEAAPDSSVIDQIARVARATAARSGQQIVVRLNPPELGRVRLTLHADGNDVRGVLKVEDPNTLTELQREAGPLVQRLAESGIQLRRLDIDLSNDGSGGSDSGRSLARGGQGQTHGGPDDMGQQAAPDSAGDENDRNEADAAAAMQEAYHVGDESINVWI